jgi:predicted phage tail protein
MLQNVYLHGDLGEKFGNHWEMNAPTVIDALKLIECQTEGFRKYLIDSVDAGLEAAIVVKDREIEESLEVALKMHGDVHIAMMPSGAKKGWGRLILAAVIMYITYGSATGIEAGWAGSTAMVNGVSVTTLSLPGMMAMSFGLSLAMMGITELTTKAPKHDKDDAGGLFNGPESTLVQGTPIPILYGELLIGGKAISANFKAGNGTASGSQVANVINWNVLGPYGAGLQNMNNDMDDYDEDYWTIGS